MAHNLAHQARPAYHLTRAGTGFESILSAEACAFLVRLHEEFSAPLQDLLDRRRQRQRDLDSGQRPDFLSETRELREADWHIAPIPSDLSDRRVEITGPVDRKMIINALNSGARVFMADFEDAHSPTWLGTLAGQQNLIDAVRRRIQYESPEGRVYRLHENVATLMVRPRGWHLLEKHFLVHGQPIPAALFDFGLFFFHNARYLLKHGSGPYFYLPKLENHREARLWNQVFERAQAELGIAQGSIKVTVLIETVLAAFEMDEILYELRSHITGLNCGRWDYIFSFIKSFHQHPEFVLPERALVTMQSHFLRSYSQLLIKTCHRRGAFAMGGMAAHIPVRDDPVANEEALSRVWVDKEREAGDGHDGTWVAHPGLVPVATHVFDDHMPGLNQLGVLRNDVTVQADDLLTIPEGKITEQGVRDNISAALRYMAVWLGGRGAVPLNNRMEDAATAEIARSQLWQWIRYPKGRLDDGRSVTLEMFRRYLAEELDLACGESTDLGFHSDCMRAARLLIEIVEDDSFEPFLTLSAYQELE